MSGASNIEWTDAVWNPVTGCTRVSSGCDHCYAVAMSHRIEHMMNSPAQPKYHGLTAVNGRGERHFNGVVRCHEDALEAPLHWRKPRRIFVNSMSDLFHKAVPFEFIDKVFAVMALCPHHTFQVLTKRPGRMAEYFHEFSWGDVLASARHNYLHGPKDVLYRLGDHMNYEDRSAEADAEWIKQAFATQGGRKLPQNWPLPNVWLGTSVEDQATADERIPHLLRCPAAVRFLSVEPMLGPVDMHSWWSWMMRCASNEKWRSPIHWVIVGGESGPGARPMHPDWVGSVRDQCAAAGVPFFFKQWGDWGPDGDPIHHAAKCIRRDGSEYEPGATREHVTDAEFVFRLGKSRAGAVLDEREHREWPETRVQELQSSRVQEFKV